MTSKNISILCLLLSAVVLFSGCANSFSPASTVEAAGPVFTKKSFIGQIGPIPDTTLLTPTTDGDFRISIYLSAGAGTISGSINVHPKWTEENGTVNGATIGVFAQLFNQSAPQAQLSLSNSVIHAIAGQPIIISGVGTDNLDFKYNAFVTLEPLQ